MAIAELICRSLNSSLKPYELLHTAQDEALRTVSSVIANYDSQKYNQGLIYLFANWIYWGQCCWWDNPDTVGSGDRVFLVAQDTVDRGQLHFSLISYQDSVARLPLPISQFQANASILQSVEQVRNTSQLRFVGNDANDQLLIVNFGALNGQTVKISDIYAEVYIDGCKSQLSANTGVVGKYAQGSLGVVNLVEKPEGIVWNIPINDELITSGIEIKPYQKLGLAVDANTVSGNASIFITVVTAEGIKDAMQVTKSDQTEKGLVHAIASSLNFCCSRN